MIRLWAALLVTAVPLVAHAQALSCQLPASVERPRPDGPDSRTPRRLIPIAGYTLAISWSPQFCRDQPTASRFQCSRENRFGFVLHGLWPDGPGKDWPQYCRAVELLPEATIRANLCATPSVQLLQHEWAKHGSCMGGNADDYFGRARTLYGALRYPDMAALSRRRPLSAGNVAQAMARANTGLSADRMRVTATRGGWLDEIWICLDRRFRYKRCAAHQGGLAPTAPVRIWRGG